MLRKFLFGIVFFLFCFLQGYFLGLADYSKTENKKENLPPSKFHQSAFVQVDIFEEAFSLVVKKRSPSFSGYPKGAVVNHHLLASPLIAEVFQTLASEEIMTVVLLSPNHFSQGKGKIIVSELPWKTPYGFLFPESDLLSAIDGEKRIITIEEEPFKKEHGIANIIPFIKKSFPNAKVIPIIFRDETSREETAELAKLLSETLPKNSLVIASLDFSHDLISDAADFHDAKSKTVLQNLDLNGVDSTDVDSRPALRTLLEYSTIIGAETFTLFGNTNSAKIIGRPNQEMPTSYITGVFSEGEKENIDNSITMLAFGDIMLDRYVRKTLDQKGFEHILPPVFQRFMQGNDITLANLEGSFSSFVPKPATPNMLAFTFDPKWASSLKKAGITSLSLANNHILNYGHEGVKQTKEILNQHEISFFGSAFNQPEEISVIHTVRGKKIGIIGYHSLFDADTTTVLTEIKRIRNECNIVIVYAHWGTEYQHKPSLSQKETAHAFLDAGADTVIGAHAHVVQAMEIYNGKPIFYSLGNFVFDQVFSEAVKTQLAVGIVFEEEQWKIFLFPLYREKDFSVALLNGDKRKEVLQDIASWSDNALEKNILNGFFTIPFSPSRL
jgi:AmmeMemoRadiSam system protein B